MARERPTASNADDSDLVEDSNSAAPELGIPPGDEPKERADIVLRAGRLGFSRTRVATALGISHDELLRIEQRNQ